MKEGHAVTSLPEPPASPPQYSVSEDYVDDVDDLLAEARTLAKYTATLLGDAKRDFAKSEPVESRAVGRLGLLDLCARNAVTALEEAFEQRRQVYDDTNEQPWTGIRTPDAPDRLDVA
jgi:hypothetical protein